MSQECDFTLEHVRLEDLFTYEFFDIFTEVRCFNRNCLLEKSVGFKICGDELRSSLMCVFSGDIVADCSAFVENESVIILNGFQVFRLD